MTQPHTNLEVTIEKLVYGGDGLARVDGQVALVPFVLPGERATVDVTAQKSGLLRAKLVEVREASEDRVVPPCPYFIRCGGCHYQHAKREAQMIFKGEILLETLQRVGRIPSCRIEVLAAEPWHYRNRVQLHIHGTELGYREAHSNRFVAIEICPTASPRLNEAIAALRGMLRDARWPRFVSSLELFSNETQLQLNVLETGRPVARRFFEWCAELLPGLVPGPLDYSAAGHLYRVSGGSFFQVNRHLIDAMVDLAMKDAQGESALDLYAGVGLFSLPLAARVAKVSAVESGISAIRDLRFNAERASLSVDAHQTSVDAFLASLTATPDFVLADPPRSGLGKTAVAQLARLRPPRLTIVSCDPATLARDLAGLLRAGYRIQELTMVDLFPQTFHIETIVQLRLEDTAS